MKLRTKMGLSFAVAFAIFAAVLYFGLVGILDTVSRKLMRKQAEDITLLMEHEIIDAAAGDASPDPTTIKAIFERVKHVSDEGGSFDISTFLLLDRSLVAVAAFPASAIGEDYSSHADIKEAFDGKTRLIAEEISTQPSGPPRREVDVVSWFETSPGEGFAIEVKLDFAKSTALLERQYAIIETGAIGAALFLLASLLGSLLVLVGRSAVRPVAEVTRAMERVGSGDLDVALTRSGKDEFGLMTARFNEMVRGLKERTKLSQYVSRSTVAAVRSSVDSGASGHAVSRRRCTLFFSDIRGFTAFSESRDPAQVIRTLNLILSLQADIVKRSGGDVDKFVGDEVMAVFPAALPAMEAAFEIQKAMASRRDELERLSLGIGIHEGEVVQGDVGSQDTRNYTVIGDAVNTAARLEAKAGAGEILVSEAVAGHDEVKARFTLEERGELALKGKAIAIRTFSVKARKRTSA